jgi:hypothetical protein
MERAMDWSGNEPKLAEILADPIVHAVMEADGFDRRRLCEILLKAAQATTLPSVRRAT